jgi:hypothetical protein
VQRHQRDHHGPSRPRRRGRRRGDHDALHVKEGLLDHAFASKAYRRIYPAETLATYASDNACPLAEAQCEETVGFHQRLLLGTRQNMDDIVNAVLRLYENRTKLAG